MVLTRSTPITGEMRPIIGARNAQAHSDLEAIQAVVEEELISEDRRCPNQQTENLAASTNIETACKGAQMTEESLLTINALEKTNQQPVRDYANVESRLGQPVLPPAVIEELQPANISMNDQDEVTVLVDVGKNEGMEWKVSERMPVHICGKAADSSNAECVFGLCGNCFVQPNTRQYAGRKRTRGVACVKDTGCNHKDMNTLRSFDAPSFFTDTFRNNQLKYFPTKCAICEVAFRDRLSKAELELERI
jgi:hypothetical protein